MDWEQFAYVLVFVSLLLLLAYLRLRADNRRLQRSARRLRRLKLSLAELDAEEGWSVAHSAASAHGLPSWLPLLFWGIVIFLLSQQTH